MPIKNCFAEMLPEITEWRRDFHQNSELLFDVHRTAARVAELCRSFGCDEVVEGFGETGAVVVIKGKTNSSGRVVGLRADMDASPILEQTGLGYVAKALGKMHACGHDGHTAMLLGAAKYLAETRNFDGMAVQWRKTGFVMAYKRLEEHTFTWPAIHAENDAIDPPKSGPAKPRNANRGSLPKHLPRIEEVIEPEASICPCWGRPAPDRRGPVGTPRCDPGPVPRRCHPPPKICLPILLKRCGASARTGTSDPRWHADRGDGRACAGLQICRPSPALSAGPDLQPPGH
jgi:hypothetical protein